MGDSRVVHLGWDEFCGLGPAWDALLLASPACVPFLTHSWLRAWWGHFGGQQRFVCLAVRRDGDLLAAAPLALRETRALGVRLRVAEIVGTGPVPTRGMGLADKADLIVRAGEPEAGRNLTAALGDLIGEVDLVDLKGLDSRSTTLEHLGSAAGPRATRFERSSSPYLALDGGYDAYVASRSQRFRKGLKRSRRGLEGLGPLELRRYEPPAAVEPWIDEIVEVNRSSWKGSRGTGLLQHPALRAFFRDLLPQMARSGTLDLHVLRVGGTAAAYELAFDVGGRVFAYNASFRENLAPHSPGNLMTLEVIRCACERGRREYDMLRGDEPYKLRWSGSARSEVQLLLVAPGLRAGLGTALGPALKARLRRVGWLVELDDRISGALHRARGG